MKNKSRVFLALLLALTVVLSLSVPSIAVGTGKITIENNSSSVSMNGHTYKAYKIFDVTYNAEKTNYEYTVATNYVPFFEGLNLSETLGENLDARAYSFVLAKAGDNNALQDFANDVLAFITTNSIAEDGKVVSSSATSAEITALDLGYYLVYDESAPAGTTVDAEKIIANLALTNTDPEATVILKASVPGLSKKITGVSDGATNATSATGESSVTATINQHVSFQIDSNVPDLTNYTDYTFKMTDHMSEGLTSDNNVKVTVKGTDETANCNITSAEQDITVIIPFSVLSRYAKDDPIAITYSATVNSKINIYPSTTPNTNEAFIEYSNDVDNSTTTTTTTTTEVKVHTFTLKITKKNPTGQTLEGAEFTIKDSAGNYVPVAKSGDRYKVSDTLTAIEDNAKVVSDASGLIYIDGLAAGTYTLHETKAPTNYNKLKEDVTVNIRATYNADGTVNTVTGNDINVVNIGGSILPTTGGIGTYIFTISGAVIMVTMLYLLISRKKKGTINN